MYTADEKSADLVAGYRDWVAQLCLKFSRATGWTVRLVKGNHQEADAAARTSHEDDFDRRFGVIELLLPSTVDDKTRQRASSATRLLVEMIQQVGGSWRDHQRNRAEVLTLAEMGRAATSSSDERAGLQVLMEGGLDLAKVENVSVHLIDVEQQKFVMKGEAFATASSQIRNSSNRPVDVSKWDVAAFSEEPVLLTAGKDGRVEGPSWLPENTAAAACVAVLGHDGPLGTIWASTRRQGPMADSQIEVLQTVADQVGVLQERMAVERESRTDDRVARELKGLSEYHSGERLGILPPGTGFDAVGRCRSRYEVGGDLCEMRPLSDGRTLVAVGDACGHSVQAAFVMTAVRSAMSAVLDEGDVDDLSPARVVTRINRALCRVTPGHQFMTCLVGVIDTIRMGFEYCNAGHPLPIVLRKGECQELETHGMPMGISPDANYSSSEFSLRGDDVLALFSDGVIESMNSEEEMFGTNGVISALEASETTEPIEVVMRRIWDSCQEHGEGTAKDDTTLLLLRMGQKSIARGPHRRQLRRGDANVPAATPEGQFSL